MRWLLVLFLILLWAMCAGVVFFLREVALWAKLDKDRAEEEARAAERDPYFPCEHKKMEEGAP